MALGNPQIPPRKDWVAEAAFGSLLHMVQDSLSNAHAERAEATGVDCAGVPGPRQPGNRATGQDHLLSKLRGADAAKHDVQDAFDALQRNILQSQPSVLEVPKTTVNLWRTKTNWAAAQAYFSCVFAAGEKVQPAAPGDAFRRN